MNETFQSLGINPESDWVKDLTKKRALHQLHIDEMIRLGIPILTVLSERTSLSIAEIKKTLWMRRFTHEMVFSALKELAEAGSMFHKLKNGCIKINIETI